MLQLKVCQNKLEKKIKMSILKLKVIIIPLRFDPIFDPISRMS